MRLFDLINFQIIFVENLHLIGFLKFSVRAYLLAVILVLNQVLRADFPELVDI